MSGRIVGAFILAAALAAGVGMYYLQVFHFYERLSGGDGAIALTPLGSDRPEPVAHSGFRGIDAASSPIRYRACFESGLDREALAARYRPYAGAVPLTAPFWFDCYDASEIGAALEEGRAAAFLGEENVIYGVDRVVSVGEGGQGHVWHQINRCGERVFDGEPAPAGCPAPPSR